MLDAVSLGQQRTFIAAVDEGSFCAASGKLLRSQSVASETISNLVDQIGVPLLDRSGRYLKLTPAGVVLLADARSIVTGRGFVEGAGQRHVGWPRAGIVGGDRRLLSDRSDHPGGQGVSAALSGRATPRLGRGTRRGHSAYPRRPLQHWHHRLNAGDSRYADP
jgi:Bacterial regulatory helix-turn-helix protein, lysR family